MKKLKHKCECPERGLATDTSLYLPEEYSGMFHEPNECKGTNEITLNKRNDKELWLCSCCILLGDIKL